MPSSPSSPVLEAAITREHRRNFAFNVGDIAIWWFGMAFVSVSTILPVYVSHLTDSKILLGLIPAIVDMGWFLPQLFTAPIVSRLPRKKPMVLALGAMERLPFFAVAAVILLLADAPHAVGLTVFFALLLWRSLASGLNATAWQELMAKVIPSGRRGRFFGTGQFFGGLLGVIGALTAGAILARFPFPQNFAYCFLAGFVAVMISYSLLAQTIEHAELPQDHVPAGRDYFLRLPSILRQDGNFLAYIVFMGLANFGSMANAFYAVAGMDRFRLADEQAGVFTAILLGAGVLSNLVWGYVGDRWGHKLTLEYSLLLSLGTLTAAIVARSPEWYYLVFVLAGAANSAAIVGSLSIISEFGRESTRPTYIGLNNTLRAPIIGVAPLIGGWLAGRFGYPVVFLIAVVPILLGLGGLHFLVRDPRHALNGARSLAQLSEG